MTAFASPLDVQLLDAEREGRLTARLLQPFSYQPAAGSPVIQVPAGFVTDFASVPRGLWNIEPPIGETAKAAVIHDFLYATKGLQGRYSRAQADAIFRQALATAGLSLWKRSLLWAAVRLGGGRGWGR